MILGIDEVGRGPWAGPLVVGAVVLGEAHIDGITDSKKLTKKRREALYDDIMTHATGVGLGWVSAPELDEMGMSQALCEATKRAVREVAAPFHEIIIDGTVNFLRDTPLSSHVSTLKKADLLIESVGAASIVAKVARDRYMCEQAKTYPEYGFASHAGYGTKAHQLAIEAHGVTPLHRLSFKPLQKYAEITVADDAPSATPTTRAIGDMGESAVCEHLRSLGHTIYERNWRTKLCEIDIVSQKGSKLYFTEVKYRKNAEYGDGLEAITPAKLRQMRRAAEMYLACNVSAKHLTPQLAVASVSGNPAVVGEWLVLR